MTVVGKAPKGRIGEADYDAWHINAAAAGCYLISMIEYTGDVYAWRNTSLRDRCDDHFCRASITPVGATTSPPADSAQHWSGNWAPRTPV